MDYFAVLKQHGVAHVFNSWADMPSVKEQLALDGSRTNPNLCAARFLLKPGRKYQEAVELFEPYDKTKEPNADARAAGAVSHHDELDLQHSFHAPRSTTHPS